MLIGTGCRLGPTLGFLRGYVAAASLAAAARLAEDRGCCSPQNGSAWRSRSLWMGLKVRANASRLQTHIYTMPTAALSRTWHGHGCTHGLCRSTWNEKSDRQVVHAHRPWACTAEHSRDRPKACQGRWIRWKSVPGDGCLPPRRHGRRTGVQYAAGRSRHHPGSEGRPPRD